MSEKNISQSEIEKLPFKVKFFYGGVEGGITVVWGGVLLLFLVFLDRCCRPQSRHSWDYHVDRRGMGCGHRPCGGDHIRSNKEQMGSKAALYDRILGAVCRLCLASLY